jgi:hypothetical protein
MSLPLIPSGSLDKYDRFSRKRLIDCGWTPVHIRGRNQDIDTGSVEDLISSATEYPWPSVATTTVVVSDSADDTSEGTGARTIKITILNSSYELVSVTVTMNGTSNVDIGTAALRVLSAEVVSVGSNGVNVGNISVKQDMDVLSEIQAGAGQSTFGVYTVPYSFEKAWLLGWFATINKSTSIDFSLLGNDIISADVSIMIRKFNGQSWLNIETIGIDIRSNWSYVYPVAVMLEPRTDIKLIASVSENNTDVSVGIDLLLEPRQ